MKKLIISILFLAVVFKAGAFVVDGGVKGHVQGMAVDAERGYMYFSFTTRFIQTDMEGNILKIHDRINGHLGDMTLDKESGLVYASLECKDDEIGRGIAQNLGTEVVSDSHFYIAVIDPSKLGTDEAVNKVEVLPAYEDYKSGKYGCSGIDGIAIAPRPGKLSSKALYVAYGIYGDTTRTDNDNQILLCYDLEKLDKAPQQYKLFTGNTTWGVQNMEYDPYTGLMYLFVYRGRKSQFPNWNTFAVDLSKKPSKYSLELEGGWNFRWGTTGFFPMGDGSYWFSESYSDPYTGNQKANVRKYAFSGDKAHYFVTDDPYAPSEYAPRKALAAGGLFETFQNPGNECRPFVRWWWNGDKVEADEIRRELALLKEAGIGGVEINPIKFPGGEDIALGKKSLKWLSDEWIEMLQVAFDEAEKLGMTCDLIIGSGWPFGAETLPEEDRACVMLTLAEEVSGGSVYETSKYNIYKKVDPGVSVVNPRRTCELVSMKLAPATISSIDDVIDVTDRFNGETIRLEIPEGKHFVYSLVRFNSFASVINGAPGAAGSILNHMDSGAVRRYLDNMSNTIEAKTGPLSKYLRAFFVDSMELEGNNWTDDFAEEFKKRRGYDIMPWLPLTMFKVGRLGNVEEFKYGSEKTPEFKNQLDRVRFDFELTKAELLHERYTRTFLQWCKDHNVKSRAQAYGRGFFPLESSLGYDIPEGESWTTNWLRHRIGEEMGDEDYRRGRGYTMINKYVSSAAHLTGKRLVSAEEMTNTYKVFSTSLEFLKVGSDMSAISGTTHSVWHGFNYNPKETEFPGWVQYGSYYNEKNTWWPYFHLLNEYRARMASILQKSDMVTDIALLPANYDMWGEMSVPTDPFPVDLNIRYTSLVWEAIHKNGGGADYVTENIIDAATVRDGKLCYGPKAYGDVFLVEVGGTTPSVLGKLLELVKQGGRVFCIGKYPDKSLGYLNFEERDKEIQALVEELKTYKDNFILLEKPEDGKYLEWYTSVMNKYSLPHAVTVESPDRFLLQNHYIADDRSDIFLFVNAHMSEERSTSLVFPDAVWTGRQAWVYDPSTGKRSVLPLEGGRADFTFGPSESYLIVFNDDPRSDEEVFSRLPESGENEFTLTGPWTLSLHQNVEGWTKEYFLDTLCDLKDIEEYKYFMGDVTYRTIVDNKCGLKYINLGKVADICELRINGEYVGTAWFGKRIFNVEPYLKDGSNTIEIKVTTLMSNYVGTLKDNKVAQRYVIKRKTPLLSAGLIGPVKLYK